MCGGVPLNSELMPLKSVPLRIEWCMFMSGRVGDIACVAVCCSLLQCGAVCCSLLQCGAV